MDLVLRKDSLSEKFHEGGDLQCQPLTFVILAKFDHWSSACARIVPYSVIYSYGGMALMPCFLKTIQGPELFFMQFSCCSLAVIHEASLERVCLATCQLPAP